MNSLALRRELDDFLRTCDSPLTAHGRGIVTCAGGLRYNTCAWVLIRTLRDVLGCQLPIEVWYLGDEEKDPSWIKLVEPWNVRCRAVQGQGPESFHRRAQGWASKSHALLHSDFAEVLFLDADNLPVVNPEFLFEEPEYRRTGAVFWPDSGVCSAAHPLWNVLQIPGRSEREFESGQMLVDKTRCSQALSIANWFNERAEFFYRYLYGDKDTFRLAWHVLQQEFAMPAHGLVALAGTLCQHDFSGRRLFQHRCFPKWSLRHNPRIPGFEHEREALAFLAELCERWNPLEKHLGARAGEVTSHDASLIGRRFRLIERFLRRGRLELGAQHLAYHHPVHCDAYWWPDEDSLSLLLADRSTPFRLARQEANLWSTAETWQARPELQLVAC